MSELTERDEQLITGKLMGDGWVQRREHSDNSKPCVGVRNSNPFYVKWFRRQLSIDCGRVSCDGKGRYQFYTTSLEELNKFADWYSSGKKRYPDNLELTPELVRIWYCDDGTLQFSGANTVSIRLCSDKEKDRIEWLQSLFQDEGFYPSVQTRGRLYFGVDEVEPLLDWMGGPPEGMEYKWDTVSRKSQKALKPEVYYG